MVQQSKHVTNTYRKFKKQINWINDNKYYVFITWLFLLIAFVSLLPLFFSTIGSFAYDLSLGVFVSAIFTVLTIVFLTWGIQLKEEQEWKKVRIAVIFDLKLQLSDLFGSVLVLTKDGNKKKFEFWKEYKDSSMRKLKLKEELKTLSSSEKLELNFSEIDKMIYDKDFIRHFSDARKKLSETQTKFAKFIPAKVALSLFKIQQRIDWVENISSALKMIKENPDRPVSFDFPFPKSVSEDVLRNSFLPNALLGILIELNELHTLNVDFNYPVESEEDSSQL